MVSKQARFSTSSVSDHGKRAFFIILALALITTLAPINSLFSWLDLKSADFLFSIKPLIKTETHNHPAVVITKDQTFFERFGRDPDRGDFARLLYLLQKSGTQIAALDFIFDQASEPEIDRNFIAALGSFSYPIAAHHFLSRGKQTFEIASLVDQNAARPPWPLPVLKEIDQAIALKGLVNIIPDFDSTIRYVPIAFHPVEMPDFIPSLGFAAWTAYLFSKQSQAFDQEANNLTQLDPELMIQKITTLAPFKKPKTGHHGIDEMIENLELQLIVHRLCQLFPAKAKDLKKLDLQNFKIRPACWLQLHDTRLPIIGNYEAPCLRLNFQKTAPPVKSDGIEQISMGTLLKTEQDLAGASSLFSPDLEVSEESSNHLEIDFSWIPPGSSSISGQLGEFKQNSMQECEIRVEFPESGFWQTGKTQKDGSFILENLPPGIFNITLVSRQKSGWIKATASGRLEPGQQLQLPQLDLIMPECNLSVDAKINVEQAQICVFGEAIYLQKTDGEGRLSFNIPEGMNPAPLNQDIEFAGITEGRLLDSQNQPIANEMVAILSDIDFWSQNFFFRFNPGEKIQLPSSINCQIAVFSKSATIGQQKTLDITVFPGEANLVKELPAATYIDSQARQIYLSNPALNSVLMISETEEWLNVLVNQPTTIPSGRYRIFAEYRGKRGRFNSLKARLKDRAVFVGTALQEDQDLISTPINFFDPAFPVIPGVHLHANLFSGLVRGDFLDAVFFHSDRAPTTWHLWQAVILLPLLFACNLIFFHRGAYWGGLGILASSAIWLTTAVLFFRQGILLPIFYPILNFASFGVLRGYYAWEIARRKETETRSTFGRFISAAVVEEIMKTPDSLKPGGEKKELTIMFTDLAGFTTISEKLPPEKLTDLMNEYLGEMTSLLFKYGGTLDKYIGDAIMAFWNHPRAIADHPQQAALCAIAMQHKLAELREKWLKQGLPEVQVRAGINTATCMVGFIGSDVQMNFTCLGDGVNLASRLEGANKNYGTLNMIAESVQAKLDSKVFSTRFLDYLAVKGKEQPIKVYELRCLRKDETDAWNSADSIYHQGIDFYINREWDQAISSFNQVLNIVPEDEPSKLFIERCNKFKIAPPPEKWDGRYILKTK
ncbi:MAG: CHASE2 domain-containing protein [Candidatus Rifleibacteriota bacterium]